MVEKEVVSAPKILECSILGDKRFAASCAMVSIHGTEKSIEEWFDGAKRDADGNVAEKGKPYDHICDPFTGDDLPVKDAKDLYQGLWVTYLNEHPNLVEYASQFDEFKDSTQDPNAREKQIAAYEADPFNSEAVFFYLNPGLITGADVLGAYVKGNRDYYLAGLRHSHWYINIANKNKLALKEQIRAASRRANPSVVSKGKEKDFSN